MKNEMKYLLLIISISLIPSTVISVTAIDTNVLKFSAELACNTEVGPMRNNRHRDCVFKHMMSVQEIIPDFQKLFSLLDSTTRIQAELGCSGKMNKGPYEYLNCISSALLELRDQHKRKFAKNILCPMQKTPCEIEESLTGPIYHNIIIVL